MQRVFNYILAAVFVAVLCASGSLIAPVYFDYRELRLKISGLEKSLAEQKRESASIRQEINALRKDRNAIERVAREKFGWCRDNEKIYHFDLPAGLMPPSTAPEQLLTNP